MRVSNMSTHDKTTTFSNEVLNGRPDQYFPTDQRQSFNNTQTPTSSSARVNGFPPIVPVSSSLGGSLQSPTMSSYQQARQPINEAVASAAQMTDSDIPPELVQLITQNVIQQMQAHKLSVSAAPPVQPPLTTPVDPVDNASSFAASPTTDRSHVYTPPSPRHSGSVLNAHGYETGIRREFSPFRNSSDEEAVFSDPESITTRPQPPRRVSTEGDLTVLEKIWGKLFDDNGNSTKTLDLFLRGIAVHLIEDYEPRNSLVVTTPKMQRFYQETKLNEQPEIYPWQLVFDDKISQMSRFYREPDMNVEHHLIQSNTVKRPNYPGLTPDGFATWMKLFIRAHPDHEFERLLQTVRTMPINNPETKERFPKDISRRLFPDVGDNKIVAILAGHMTHFCKVQVHPRKHSEAGSESSPPSSSKRTNPPAPFVEDASEDSDYPDAPIAPVWSSNSTTDPSRTQLRESASAGPLGNPVFDTSDVPTPKPLERERKPYVGQSGGGGRTCDATSSSSDEKHVNVNRSRRSSTTQDDLRRIQSTSSAQGRTRPLPPPIAIHQRDNVTQSDGPESARARRSTINNDDQGAPVQRTRSNSTYGAEVQPQRRKSRSNSTYANDANTKRYHSKRSPSLSKSGFDPPRASAPEMKASNYPPPPTSYVNNYPSNSVPQQTYDYRSQNHDTRDPRNRGRDHDRRTSRPRVQSVTAPIGTESHMYPDEHHRQQSGYTNANGNFVQPAGGSYQYVPTAYQSRDPREARDSREQRDNRENRDYRESRDSRDLR